MAGSGFHVEPRSLLVASAGFVDLQIWWAQIHQGLVTSVSDMAGMAGDDDAGHACAQRYQPAAQSVLSGVGRVYGQLGAIANGLYTMAVNYIQADINVTVDKMKAAQLPARQPECDTAPKKAQVPNVVGRTESVIDEILARFWPQGNPGKPRQAAEDWNTLAQRLQTLGAEGSSIARQVTAKNESLAVDGFARTWGELYSDACPAKQPLINALISASQRLSHACRSYAELIERQRDKLKHLAEIAGVAAGTGIVLTLVTLGASDVAAGVGEAAIAGEAAVAVVEFTEAVTVADEFTVLLEAEAIVAEAEASLTAVSPTLIAAAEVVPAIVLPSSAAAASPAEGGPINTTLTSFTSGPTGGPVGPVPHDPASPFPLLTPAEQTQFRSWMRQMALDGRTKPAQNPADYKPNMADRFAYQIRVAGGTEYELYTTAPNAASGERSMMADGVRPEDGAAIDAKYINPRKRDCTPFRIGNANQRPDFIYRNATDQVADEIMRYNSAIHDPRNKVTHLELITNDDEAAAFFDQLIRAENCKGRTRVVP